MKNSVRNIDFSGLHMPQIAVYDHPEDFKEQCVARVYDTGKPTDTVIIKATVDEIMKDIRENTMLSFFARGEEDVPCLVGVWM